MASFQLEASAVIGALPEALLITSLSGVIKYANQRLTGLTGFDESQLLDQPVSMLLPAGERSRLDVVSWFARWADNPDQYQLQYLSLSGITRAGIELRYRVRVSRFEQADTAFFLIILRDITQEHEDNQKLRHGKLVANRILAIGEDAVLSIDEKQNICYWNPRAEAMFGYSESEVLGRSIDLLLPEQAVKKHADQVQSFAASSAASKLMGARQEIQGRHKLGHLLPLEASITKTSIDGTQMISAQIRDISQRKDRERALANSELKFRGLFEAAFEAMALLSVDGTVLEINPAALTLLEPGAEPIGQRFWALHWWASESSEALALALQQDVQKVAAGQAQRASAELPGLVDGDRRLIDFSLTPVRDDDGNVVYIVAEGRDITAVGSAR